MKIPKQLVQGINRLSISTKISISFGALLLVILIEIGVSIAALNLIWNSTSSIQINAEIERTVLNMSRNWESAQRLQKIFFFQSASISSDQAYKLYALPASTKISEIIRDGARLKQINRSFSEKSPLLQKDTDIDQILSEISAYASTLQEATDLEMELSSTDTGLRQKLEYKAQSLLKTLQISDQNSNALSLYYRIRFFDEDYMIYHRESSDVAADQYLEQLYLAINDQIPLIGNRNKALSALNDYKIIRDKIILTDAGIQGKIKSLDKLGEAMEPQMVEIMTTINGDMIKNRSLIEQTRFITGLTLFFVMAAAFIFTVVIALMLNTSITRKIVKLNQIANQFQNGDLNARARVDSSDELGQLASSFNSMANQLRQTIDQTREKAEHDHLTGLYNRMGFWEASLREIVRCLRFNRPISLLFLDIDQFKNFNDRYSYEIGDRVLIHLAQCIKDDLRNIDVIGRYGGEEFVLLLPEANLSSASEVAERLRLYIESHALHTDLGDLKVTVSIGIGIHYPDPLNTTGITEKQILNKLIDQGGKMLHTAKSEGRNRVVSPEIG
jgi:diguanylate cyclase (GGDEF)-like protein